MHFTWLNLSYLITILSFIISFEAFAVNSDLKGSNSLGASSLKINKAVAHESEKKLTFLDLPSDIYLKIFQYCNLKDLSQFKHSKSTNQ